MKLKVEGMTCGGCVKSVTAIIKELDEAADVQVSLETGLVETNAKTSVEAVAEALDDAGFPAKTAD
ncbi:heavy-metal-associated domain-containing protein [Oceanobacter mangrovi]|uniref:heavy-metal-associated domain-containing protein n=1 Tax=Oceanobacter mangrovi TaxID=2862510 RepID=UPI001C8ED15D|nr:heavy metal-associated domain-containing protein [Oceanobacter mangrovi]